MIDPLTLADALDFLGSLAWAIFYGTAVGIGGYLIFILALQDGDDD
jgi:hypothetical protein